MSRATAFGSGLGFLALAWLFWREYREPGLHAFWTEEDEQAWPVLGWLRWLVGLLLCGGAGLAAAALFVMSLWP
ncbi:hypothetical protein L1280_002380 [Deinococcus sp. HSC-46F16]|uniref:hypothetical protein n=1 Tax=Deinococcus sp. HSC-46F16 TaxID=2910968 RepID=UPI0020A17791|nr:hypothetical protein [Deinococcus sp. HSC-46F16]MCP2015219.1 hypothetical protein [Deinococcus sp. HSC-46F16]